MEIVWRGVREFERAVTRRVLLMDEASRLAAAAAGHVVERRIKKQLTRYTHAPGEPTPSPPGGPPATVTGTLRRSIQVGLPHRVGFGNYTVMVGPTVIYGRIQELGGDVYPVNAQRLAWSSQDGMHFAQHVTLPARPYVEPGFREAVDSGEVWDAFRATWARAWR